MIIILYSILFYSSIIYLINDITYKCTHNILLVDVLYIIYNIYVYTADDNIIHCSTINNHAITFIFCHPVNILRRFPYRYNNYLIYNCTKYLWRNKSFRVLRSTRLIFDNIRSKPTICLFVCFFFIYFDLPIYRETNENNIIGCRYSKTSEEKLVFNGGLGFLLSIS